MYLPKNVPTPLKISLETKAMDSASDAHLGLVENFIRTRNLPVGLGADDRVVIKRSS